MSNKPIYRDFECWDELIERAERNPKDNAGRSSYSVEKSNRRGWYGTPDFPAAIKLCREGWPEGREIILNLKDKLKDDFINITKKIDIQWDVVGEQVDVGRFIEGEPECMAVFNFKEGMGKGVITICLNIIAACNVPTDIITRRGAACLTIVDILEDMGFRCEIRFGSAVDSGYNHYEISTLLKHSAQAVDLDTLAFSLAHPSMLRRIIFSVEENEPKEIKDIFRFHDLGGYGRPTEMKKLDGIDLLFPHLTHIEQDKFKTDERVVEWITTELNKILSESEVDARTANHEIV